jgi:hypothetical protein
LNPPNEIKMQAREFMSDRVEAAKLPPPTSPADILKKYDGNYEAAIEATKRSNQIVNERIEQLRKLEK